MGHRRRRGMKIAVVVVVLALVGGGLAWYRIVVHPWVAMPEEPEASIMKRWAQVEAWAQNERAGPGDPRLLREAVALMKGSPDAEAELQAAREQRPAVRERLSADLQQALARLVAWHQQGGGLGRDPDPFGPLEPLALMGLGRLALASARTAASQASEPSAAAVAGARPQDAPAVAGARPQDAPAVAGARPQDAPAVAGAGPQEAAAVAGARPQDAPAVAHDQVAAVFHLAQDLRRGGTLLHAAVGYSLLDEAAQAGDDALAGYRARLDRYWPQPREVFPALAAEALFTYATAATALRGPQAEARGPGGQGGLADQLRGSGRPLGARFIVARELLMLRQHYADLLHGAHPYRDDLSGLARYLDEVATKDLPPSSLVRSSAATTRYPGLVRRWAETIRRFQAVVAQEPPPPSQPASLPEGPARVSAYTKILRQLTRARLDTGARLIEAVAWRHPDCARVTAAVAAAQRDLDAAATPLLEQRQALAAGLTARQRDDALTRAETPLVDDLQRHDLRLGKVRTMVRLLERRCPAAGRAAAALLQAVEGEEPSPGTP